MRAKKKSFVMLMRTFWKQLRSPKGERLLPRETCPVTRGLAHSTLPQLPREKRGAGDWVQSPVPNDLVDRVCGKKAPQKPSKDWVGRTSRLAVRGINVLATTETHDYNLTNCTTKTPVFRTSPCTISSSGSYPYIVCHKLVFLINRCFLIQWAIRKLIKPKRRSWKFLIL